MTRLVTHLTDDQTTLEGGMEGRQMEGGRMEGGRMEGGREGGGTRLEKRRGGRERGGRGVRKRVVCMVCAKKTLLCTVRFTLDRLMKTEVKRLLNGFRTDIEQTTHGHVTDRARSVPFYVCVLARVTIKFYACTTHVSVADFE